MTESDPTLFDRHLHWYQRTWLWVALAFAAIPVAFFTAGNFLSVQSRVVGVVAVVVLGLAPVGLWMGALVARRPWARNSLSLLTLIVLALLIWAVWNGLRDAESEGFVACGLVTAADGQAVERDPELCASEMSGDFYEEFDAFERITWIVVAATWIAPLFILYGMRRRFEPSPIETQVSATTQLVTGVLLMIVGLLFVFNFVGYVIYIVQQPDAIGPVEIEPGVLVVTQIEVIEPGLLTVFVLLIAITMVPGVLLFRKARQRRRLKLGNEPSSQHQDG